MPEHIQSPAYRRLADNLRNEILNGDRTPGAKLPSTGDLATLWKSSPSTVHAALMVLVKEGWIERLNGAGTYIAHPENRYACAGIYHATELRSNDVTAYARNLHSLLLEEFRRIGKKTLVFIDDRPRQEQDILLPALASAIRERKIQCLVAPSINTTCSRALMRLKMPTVFADNAENFHGVGIDYDDMIQKVINKLVTSGCKTAGILAAVNPRTKTKAQADFYPRIVAAMRRAGLEVKPGWVLKPDDFVMEQELFGYTQFKRFVSQPDKPDGFFVYPDSAARGMITAVLEAGLHHQPNRTKFVLHRNANIRLICPFAAAWIVTDEREIARAMVESLEGQFNGASMSPVSIPLRIEESTGEIVNGPAS